MVVRPEDIPKFGKYGEALIQRAEEFIDRQLKENYTGYLYTVYLLAEFDYEDISYEMFEELKLRYTRAGWTVDGIMKINQLGDEIMQLTFSEHAGRKETENGT